jgi:hypothetical protein
MHSMPNTDLFRHDIGIREDHLIDTLVANDTGIKRYFLVMPVSLLETRLLHAIMAGVAFHRYYRTTTDHRSRLLAGELPWMIYMRVQWTYKQLSFLS